MLARANPTLTINVLKAAKLKDNKVKDKLLLFGMCSMNSEALRGGMSENDFVSGCEHRMEVCGSRLKDLNVAANRTIDWSVCGCGVYVFAKVASSSTQGDREQFEVTHDADKESATHVLHRFARKAVSLETLGVPKINRTWTIEQISDETVAQLSSGKRFRVDLWDDFKDEAYFDYKARVYKKFPNSPFLVYFGPDARKKAKEDREAVQEAASNAKRVAKVAAPARRRRRLTTT